MAGTSGWRGPLGKKKLEPSLLLRTCPAIAMRRSVDLLSCLVLLYQLGPYCLGQVHAAVDQAPSGVPASTCSIHLIITVHAFVWEASHSPMRSGAQLQL